MNRKPTTRIKTTAIDDVPQTLDDVAKSIAEIGVCQRARDRVQADMNDALAHTRAGYESKAAPHAARISELSRGIAAYCEAHRDQLTRGGKTKTARFATGEVSWRMRPPSVVPRGGLANVIAHLKQLKLLRFIRVKEELDKEAILAEPDAIDGVKGLSISQKEDFVIKPDATELEEIR